MLASFGPSIASARQLIVGAKTDSQDLSPLNEGWSAFHSMRIGSCADTLHFVKAGGRATLGLCALPIPGALRLPDTIGASFAATGRGWRHPTFTGRRPAPGRRARWLEIQGPVSTGSGDAPAMVVEPRPAFSGSRPQRRLPQGRRGRPKNGTGHKTSPTRVPKGNPLGRATAPLSVAE